VHSHGTWGTPGAAAAVARLQGLDAPGVRAAISLAGSMSPANTWTPCFEGATIRNLYPGRAGLQGILAVHLVGCGFTALHDAPGDVYGTILAEDFDPGATLEGLDADGLPPTFRIERNYFKLHACCLYNHPALDAVGALVAEHRLTPETVAGVAVTSIPFVERMADPDPPAMLAAKFSVPYAVAAAGPTSPRSSTMPGTTRASAISPDACGCRAIGRCRCDRSTDRPRAWPSRCATAGSSSARRGRSAATPRTPSSARS
jgi:2-methylcitrate dehydratase PrpD